MSTPTREAVPRVFVLTAGLGTRLRPLTSEVPKPLLWVGDRPQVEHVFAQLRAAGVREVIINTHHLAEQFSEAWAARQALHVKTVFEPEILGTGGALANATTALGGGPVLLWNGDMYGSPDIAALVAKHEATGASATLLVGPPSGRGTVGLDSLGFVRRVRAFDRRDEISAADYLGVAIIGEQIRRRLRMPGCLVADGMIPSLEDGESIATLQTRAPIMDIGSLAALLDVNLAWLAERGLSSWVHPEASVASDVTLERVVVGPGAVVMGGGVLRDVLVLPDARVDLATQTVARSILAPRHTLSL